MPNKKSLLSFTDGLTLIIKKLRFKHKNFSAAIQNRSLILYYEYSSSKLWTFCSLLCQSGYKNYKETWISWLLFKSDSFLWRCIYSTNIFSGLSVRIQDIMYVKVSWSLNICSITHLVLFTTLIFSILYLIFIFPFYCFYYISNQSNFLKQKW